MYQVTAHITIIKNFETEEKLDDPCAWGDQQIEQYLASTNINRDDVESIDASVDEITEDDV